MILKFFAYIKDIFSVNPVASHSRWIAQQCLFIAAYLAIYGAHSGKDTLSYTIAFLTAATGVKIGSNYFENKKEGAK